MKSGTAEATFTPSSLAMQGRKVFILGGSRMKRIKIFDTTLRDGEQSPGCSMNVSEKIDMARQLEVLGVDTIEAGFAAASPDDYNAVKAIAAVVKNARVASLARCTQEDIEMAYDAVREANYPCIHVFIATSEIHMQYKLHLTPEQVMERVAKMVRYAVDLGGYVEFSAEDASRSDREFLVRVLQTAADAGASVLNIPDTVGYATPDEMYDLVRYVRENVKASEDTVFSVHCHNDLGLAVANSLAAVRAGAQQVECTVNGIGERAGNAALEEVVMSLATRSDLYDAQTGINSRQIYRTSRLLSTIIGSKIAPNKPIVGANAFAHEAGIHQHGMLCNRKTYEIITPQSVGVPVDKIVLGKHSGKHALREHIEQLGYVVDEERLEEIFVSFKALADRKKAVTDRDVEALLASGKTEVRQIYRFVHYVINTGSSITPTAIVKLATEEEETERVSIGDGPIDAAFKAVELIVQQDFEIDNYSIQAVTEGEDAQGEVVVRLKKNGLTVTGRGLSTDIIEASIRAYINAINKYLSTAKV